MINNLELIKPLLKFEDEWDFYRLYIFQRKKDQVEGVKANHQSVRTIKDYNVSSLEYLESKWEEITHLCEFFRARAYIHISCSNHKNVALTMLSELATRIKNGHHNQTHIFDHVVGQLKVRVKKYIIDVDSKDPEVIQTCIDRLNVSRPLDVEKLISIIPTRNGVHLITVPFDTEQFKSLFIRSPDIVKKNPTLLYYPDSLN